MTHRLIASTLGASMLLPAGAALARPVYSPGITFINMVDDGPMGGFSMGLEMTANDARRGLRGLSAGLLFQLETDFADGVRVNFGGQAFTEYFGAEVAYSWTWGDTAGEHGFMINPFVGIGFVNVAFRHHFDDGGYAPGIVGSLKVPIAEPTVIAPGQAGRPLRDAEGALHRPRVVVLGSRPLPTVVAGLPRASRVALGRAWLEDARDEHAAVGAFRRLARQLAARGAPRTLVRWARRSARDEVRHARACLNIAEALLGARLALVSTPVAEGPLPDLPTLARESRLDGVIAEGSAARLAALAARRATIGPVARLQGAIAREEAGHADLAHAVEGWAVAAGGAPVRHALEQARPQDADALTPGPVAPAGDEALWRRWGRTTANERRAAWRAAG